MKIQGLVRVFHQVRSQLQTGLAPNEVEPFRARVQAIIREVEAICRKHGLTPQQLPGPSRQAYAFLRELDLDHLPGKQTDVPAATPGFRIRNVVKLGEQLAARLWRQLDALQTSAEARAQLEQELTRQALSIEQLCAQHQQAPAALETPSRQVYGWLKLLASEDHLTLYVTALQRAKEAIDATAPRPLPVHVYLWGMTTLWQRRVYQDAVLLKINVGFLSAESSVWQAIMHNALVRRDPAHEQIVRAYAESEEFSETLFALESFTATTTASRRGRAHDLDESFARVNAAYFDGQMPKPTLVWNRTLTARKFGHYQASRDTVMLSVSLDDARVPAFVVDFVLYHELLHKKHGAMIVNGRRLVHSPAFRAEERRFAEYHRAEQQIHELALRQRGLLGNE
jgi:hypothetical protein